MGTTSQKLQYLTTTKSNIKDAINLTGANILSEDTFRSYVDKLKQGLVDAINDGGSTIYSNFPKTTGEGTEITLNNIYAAPMRTTLKGNTEQDSYTGINLLTFPYYETTKTINGITFTVQNDGIVHVEGTATAKAQFKLRIRDLSLDLNIGERYTIATSGLGVIDSTIWLDTYGQTGSFLGKWALTSSIPYASAVAEAKDIKPFISIAVENGATVNVDVKVWLYKGTYSSSITYEPYVGGVPSPNPDYPQPVKVVTGNNTINIRGKNLIDFSNATPTGDSTTYTFENDIIEVTNTNTRTYCGVTWDITSLMQRNPSKVLKFAYESFDGSNAGGVSTTQIAQLKIINSGTTSYKGLLNRAGTENTYEIPSDTSGITLAQLFIYSNNTNTPENHSVSITKPMLIFSTDTTAYEPYVTPQEYPLNLGSIELCKIPNTNYQDIIFHAINGDSFYDTLDNATKQTLTYGKWYKHSEIGKIVLDGSESWDNFQVEATGLGRAIGIGSNVLYQDNQATLLSNKLVGVKYSGSWNNTFECIATTSSNRFIAYLKNVSNLTEFTTKLASGYEVYYILATPTNTEITDTDLISQLETIRTAKSVENKTIISQTNADLPFIISASALSKN